MAAKSKVVDREGTESGEADTLAQYIERYHNERSEGRKGFERIGIGERGS